MRYFGLFKILERIGQVAYRLQLLDTASIHPMFHISLLKKCVGDHTQQVLPLALLMNDKRPLLFPIVILDKHNIRKKREWISKVLV